MKMPVKVSVFAFVPVMCLLVLGTLLLSCQTDVSSEPPPEQDATTEQETVSAADISVADFTESSSEPMPESSEITEQETPAVSSVSVEELKDKLENGSPIMLVDVRNRDDFLTNHIKGAVSIPLDEIPDRYQEIPQDKEVIVYADCA
jgi:hypothetical protein